jgi:hypothetical protein
MSALGFFRRRQRMVFWIMVILMVVFLVTINGSSQFFQLVMPNRQRMVLGQAGRVTRYDIRQGDLQAASVELSLLKVMDLGNPLRVLVDPLTEGRPTELPGELGFFFLTEQGDRRERETDTARAWLLLKHEAQELGFIASPQMAREALEQWMGWTEDRINNALPELRNQLRMHDLEAKNLYAAMQNYLLVAQAFDAQRGTLEPTEPELRHLYRDTQQRMKFAALSFPAAEYVSKVGEPTEAQLLELFNSARKEVPGEVGNPQPFKFGYRLPNRVQVEYLFVDYDDVLASTQVDEEAMYQYWQTHQQELASAPASASGPATQAAASQAASKPVASAAPMRYAQMKPEIRRRLQQREAQQRINQISDTLLSRVNAAAASSQPSSQPSTMEAIASEMLKNGVRVVYRNTRPMSPQELSADPILGAAMRLPNGPSLEQIAFSVKELTGNDRSAFSVGDAYNSVMDVLSSPSGKLIWRVSKAELSAVPTEGELANDEKLHQQVRDDWRTTEAYKLGLAAAKDAKAKAEQDGLEAVAAKLDKQVQTPPAPLSRKIFVPALAQSTSIQSAVGSAYNFMQWMQGGRKGDRPRVLPAGDYVQAAMVNPFFLVVPNAPLGEAWESDDAQKFVDAVFTLAPKETAEVLETPPASQPTNAPAPASTLLVVELPGEHQVVLVQQVQFLPAYESGYRDRREGLIRGVREMRRHDLAARWFSDADIQQRNNYQSASSK